MNHVGKQVKTVTTHTLLIAGSEARASAGPHERPHLSPRGDPAPKENGKGQPIDKDGSATSLRADGEVWRCDQGLSGRAVAGQRRTALPKVMVEEIDGSYWHSRRERLERELCQDQIVIRAEEIRRL